MAVAGIELDYQLINQIKEGHKEILEISSQVVACKNVEMRKTGVNEIERIIDRINETTLDLMQARFEYFNRQDKKEG